MSKIRTRGSNIEKSPDAPTNKRLFLRLPHEHEWRKFSPAGIREVIVKKLSTSPTLIGKIKPVNSGLALSPYSTEARKKILNAGNGLSLTGAKLEAATNWVTVLIPTALAVIRKELGKVEVINIMLADEVGRVCSIWLAHSKLYGGNKAEAPHRTWIAFFRKLHAAVLKYSTNLELRGLLKSSNRLDFVKDAMSTTPSNTALGHLHAEIVARQIIPRICAWSQLKVEIVGARIALIAVGVLPDQHARVHL